MGVLNNSCNNRDRALLVLTNLTYEEINPFDITALNKTGVE